MKILTNSPKLAQMLAGQYEPYVAEDIAELVVGYGPDDFDVVLLDVDAFGGIYAARMFNEAGCTLPIIGVSNTLFADNGSHEERLEFIEQGGAHLLAEPVSKRELLAYLFEVNRRFEAIRPLMLLCDNRLAVNFSARLIMFDNRNIPLTGKEAAMFFMLIARTGHTLTKEMFLNGLYNGMDEPELKIIDVFICKLRKKLNESHQGLGAGIETVWGRGYRWSEPDLQAPTVETA